MGASAPSPVPIIPRLVPRIAWRLRPLAGWQGIETVRRDNCLLVRNVVTTCLERILIGKDVQGAVSYVKGVIADLLMNKIDLSLLVISKVRHRGTALATPRA